MNEDEGPRLIKRQIDTFDRTGNWAPLYHDWKDLGKDKNEENPLDEMALIPSIQNVVKEINFWKDSKEWYEERKIPWKRGYLFYGPPGTGKTSFIRALAEELDFPVHLFDLSTMNNSDLQREWITLTPDAPCIVLLEDIDSIFAGRENKNKDPNALTFDCLLNEIDGIEATNGILLIITSNRPELIDDALGGGGTNEIATRPGRIDRTIKFDLINDEGKKKLANRILYDIPKSIQETLINESQGDTPAQFQERCFRFALNLHFEDERKNS